MPFCFLCLQDSAWFWVYIALSVTTMMVTCVFLVRLVRSSKRRIVGVLIVRLARIHQQGHLHARTVFLDTQVMPVPHSVILDALRAKHPV